MITYKGISCNQWHRVLLKLSALCLLIIGWPGTGHAISPWQLPADFKTNTTAYPSANSLPIITSPGPLTKAARIQAGGEYFLTNDIYARADGLVVEADNVTIDLRGHKIVYAGEALDRSYGIAIPMHYVNTTYFPRNYSSPGGSSNTTIKDTVGGGKIVKATNFARYCSGIFGYGSSSGVTVQNITIDHSGIDASGIELIDFRGAIVITAVNTQYNYLRDDSPIIDPSLLAFPPDNISKYYWVTNRHSGFVGGIKIVASKHTSASITGNTLSGSPQWGLFMNDAVYPTDTPSTRDASFFDNLNNYAFKNVIADNTVLMDIKITNGYGLGLSSNQTHAYGNTISGYGAGISLGAFYQYVHDNIVNVSQGANPEYNTRLWAHGLKFEGEGNVYANQCMVSNNSITGTTRGPKEYKDQSFWYFPGTPNQYFGHRGEARVLDLTVSSNSWNEIRNNTFRAIKNGADHVDSAMALKFTWTVGTGDFSNVMAVTNNTFETNDRFFDAYIYRLKDTTLPFPNYSGIHMINNTYTPVNVSGVYEPKMFNISMNYDAGKFVIKNPSKEYKDLPVYLFGNDTVAGLNIVYVERFCGAPTDTLTITSPQLGVVYDDALKSSALSLEMIYRTIEKTSTNIKDVTNTYDVVFIQSGKKIVASSWHPSGADDFCSSIPKIFSIKPKL